MSEAKPTDNERAYCNGRPNGSQGHEASPGISQLQAHCRFCDRRITNVLGVWMLAKGEKVMPEPPKAKYVMLDCAGKVTTCDRCGDPCRVADRRNPDSKPFRLAEKPKGVCANCVMTQFLCNTYPINLQIDEAGPELLLKPGIREAFLASGLLQGCDLNIAEVNWAKVVANWALPVKLQKGPTNPYQMGDSPKSYLHRGKPQPAADPFADKWGPILDANRGTLSGDLGREFMEESGLKAVLDEAEKKWVN